MFSTLGNHTLGAAMTVLATWPCARIICPYGARTGSKRGCPCPDWPRCAHGAPYQSRTGSGRERYLGGTKVTQCRPCMGAIQATGHVLEHAAPLCPKHIVCYTSSCKFRFFKKRKNCFVFSDYSRTENPPASAAFKLVLAEFHLFIYISWARPLLGIQTRI